MASTATATGGAPKLSYSNSSRRRLNHPSKKLHGSIKFIVQTPSQSSTPSIQRQYTVQASNNPLKNEQESSIDDNAGATSTLKEDLSYLWKLGVGSFVGAAVIKYGSILFPEITRPNFLLALIMISTPVVAAVWLLIRQSRVEQQN